MHLYLKSNGTFLIDKSIINLEDKHVKKPRILLPSWSLLRKL